MRFASVAHIPNRDLPPPHGWLKAVEEWTAAFRLGADSVKYPFPCGYG